MKKYLKRQLNYITIQTFTEYTLLKKAYMRHKKRDQKLKELGI